MKDTRKNQILIYARAMNILTCKESKFSNLLYPYSIMTFSKSCLRNKLLLASS